MKKIGILIGGAFLLAACDASPGGNHGILPVVHDEPVEHVEHHAEAHETEAKDSLSAAHTEKAAEEPKDSAH